MTNNEPTATIPIAQGIVGRLKVLSINTDSKIATVSPMTFVNRPSVIPMIILMIAIIIAALAVI